MEIVGGTLLHDGQANLIVAGGRGDRQLKTERRVKFTQNPDLHCVGLETLTSPALDSSQDELPRGLASLLSSVKNYH